MTKEKWKEYIKIALYWWTWYKTEWGIKTLKRNPIKWILKMLNPIEAIKYQIQTFDTFVIKRIKYKI